MAVLSPPSTTRNTNDADAPARFRIPRVPPPVPPFLDEDDGGSGDHSGPMRRVALPPDRFKTRLVVALVVSLLVNLAFYNQAAVWGKQVRVVFLRALHQQYAPPPAQIILVAPHAATQPGGKTTFTPLAAAAPPVSASPSPSPTPQAR